MEQDGEALAAARKSLGYSREALAALAGTSPVTVRRAELGLGLVHPSTWRKLRDAIAKLNEQKSPPIEKPVNTKGIPVVGVVGAGNGITSFRSFTGDSARIIPDPMGWAPKGVMAVQVQGDSMTPTLMSGDYCLFVKHRLDLLVPGQIVYVHLGDDGAMVKQFAGGNGDGLTFFSQNPTYPPVHVPAGESMTLGLVVGLYRELQGGIK